MNADVIIDVILGGILLIFMGMGARRGLFGSLAGFAIVIVALVGAGMISAAFAEPVADVLQPMMERHIAKKVDGAMGEMKPEGEPSGESGVPSLSVPEISTDSITVQTEKILKALGLDEKLDTLGKQVEAHVRETGIAVASAVAENLMRSLVHTLLFVLSFAVLMLLLRLLMHAMNLVLRLPGLHLLNAAGGGAIGLLEGALLLFLVVWVLRQFGAKLPEESGSILLTFFTTNSPLGFLSSL